jgi:acyl-CoA thioesterase FadM
MNLIFRLMWVAVTSMLKPKISGQQPGKISLMVLPNDLDLNLHVNNGRYLTLMDLGRVDLIIRHGMIKLLRQNGWNPVIASIHTTFRRSLLVFQRFEITTEIVGWDDKWIYMVQSMHHDGREVAKAIMKTVFISKTGKVSPGELVKAMGYDPVSPIIPAQVLKAVED